MPQRTKGILIAKNEIINHIEKLHNKCYQRPSFFSRRRLHPFKVSSNKDLLSRAKFNVEERKAKMPRIRKINETLIFNL